MNISEDIDQRRRRVKKRRSNWAQFLVRPQTLKVLVATGKLIAQVIGLFYELNKILQG